MKISFSDGHKTLTANRIIRCRVKNGGVFHVLINEDEGEVSVYVPSGDITCYQVDGKELTNG